jgi:hypothetical protein
MNGATSSCICESLAQRPMLPWRTEITESAIESFSPRCRPLRARVLIIAATVLFMVCGLSFPQSPLSDGPTVTVGTLRVLSLRRMSETEIKADKTDFFARNILVLRYESPSDRPVYLYAPPNCPPEGFLVERREGKVYWAASEPSGATVSPGFQRLRREIGTGWIFLPPNSAIEWERRAYDTPAKSEYAFSVFVRRPKEPAPKEVLSNWITAPSLK